MNEISIFENFVKPLGLVGFMGLCLYIFYKKDEFRRSADLIEREALRLKIDKQEEKLETYLRNDSLTMQKLIIESNRTSDRQTKVMERTNEIITCLIKDLKDIRTTETYKNLKREL